MSVLAADADSEEGLWPPRIIGAGFAIVGLLLTLRTLLIGVPFTLDANEGWNAYQAARALGAGPLYPPPGTLLGNNYPPLSFYLVGWAGRIVGDPIVAGRIIALLALFVTAGCAAAAVRRLAGERAPIVAALLILGFAVTLFRSYLGIDDPQWLAHALMTAGLTVLIPPRAGVAPSWRTTAAAALLMLAGGLVKHNLVALPLAATLWLAWHHRPAALVWAATAGIGLGVAAAGCAAAYGPAFFADLLDAPRHYSTTRMLAKALPVVAATLPLMVVAAGLWRHRRGDPRLDLLLIAAALAVPFGIVQRSGDGVDRNAHFEALIALAVAAAVALDLGTPAARRRAALLLVLPFAVLVPLALAAGGREIAARRVDNTAWGHLVQRIATIPGPVACEGLALCYRAGKPFTVDWFLYGQRVALGGSPAAFVQALDTRRFGAVELEPRRRARAGELPDPLAPLVEARYRLAFTETDGRRLFVPPSAAVPTR